MFEKTLADVLSWHEPKESVASALAKLKDLNAEEVAEIVDILEDVHALMTQSPEVTYTCMGCGAKWTTRERPCGCPLCQAPNCDLSPKP